MRRLRAEHAQSFAKTRTSGHLLGALAQEEGVTLETAPTAHVSDYPAANKFQLEVNKDALQNGKSKELERWDRWKGELGVAAFNAKNDYSPDGVVLLQVSAVMGEFNSCFRDGVFTMAATKQFSEAAKKIKGGWLNPYKNVLFYDELEQKKSVVAISDVHTFSMHCPFTYDVVDAVHHVLQAKIPKYQGVQLQPVELTFFLGVTAASCTLWHTDSAEHKDMVLELTTLTLLSEGTTSMCIAGCKETELKEPFDTVVFDPMLYHRSGTTFPHVVKLSIHWKLRSVPVAGPSGVKPEKKPPVEPAWQAAVDEELEVLGAREDPEAVKRRKELLGVQTGTAFIAPASEPEPVVKAVFKAGLGLVKVEQVPVVVKKEKEDEKVVVKNEKVDEKVIVKKETTSPRKNSKRPR